MTQGSFKSNRSPFGGVMPLVAFVGIFVLLYFLATGIFKIVSALAIPIAVIAFVIAAIIDFSVITDYFKYIVDLVKRKPLYGIGMGVFTFFAFPLVLSYLAVKAYMRKKIKTMIGGEPQTKKEEYTEYEEVEENEDFLELEDLNKPKPEKRAQQSRNDYEDLFE